MKRIILIISSFLLSSLLWADIITVSNNPDSPGMYMDLQTAIDAAMDGDTILIAGSPTSYGIVTIDKKLRLVGPGISPQHRQNSYTAVVSQIELIAAVSGQGASGSRIEGLVFGTGCSFNNMCAPALLYNASPAPIKITDVTVERNLFMRIGGFPNDYQHLSLYRCERWVIQHNLLAEVGVVIGTDSGDIIIQQNVFSNEPLHGFIGSRQTATGVVVSNNIFFGDDQGSLNLYHAPTGVYNVNFSNNIFYRVSPDPYAEAVQFCTFTNNISFDASSNIFPTIGNNSGSGNLEDIDPQFVSIAPGATNYIFDDDLHLMPGSPGENAGTDGTNIGIYGGTLPFPLGSLYDLATSPAIPEITEMNILNSALKKTDQLQVQIKANSNN